MNGPIPVVVVHWRKPDWCAATVRSVLASEIPVHVWVVDNERSGGDALSSWPAADVTVLPRDDNAGYAAAANDGVRRALASCDSDVVVVACHDVQLAPATLGQLVDVARTHARIGLVGPALPGRVPSGRGEVVDVPWVSGTCMVITRACWHELGGFDESFGSYVEDVDLGLRAGDLGWRVVVVAGAAAGSQGSASPDRATTLIALNRVRLARKREGRWGASRAIGALGVAICRNSVGAVAPWRNEHARRASATRRTHLVHALVDALPLLGPR